MSKTLRVIVTIVSIILLVGIVAYIARSNKNGNGSNQLADPSKRKPQNRLDEEIIPEASDQSPVLESDSKIISDVAENIFYNDRELFAVSEKYGIEGVSPDQVQNPSGVREVLINAGVDTVPVVPPFINPEYQAEIETFLETRPFEEITRTSGFSEASDIYKDVMNFSSLNFSLFDSLKSVVENEGFGRISNADKNRSEDIDNAVRQFKDLFSDALSTGKRLGEVLREEAINRLRQRGYKISGYDAV